MKLIFLTLIMATIFPTTVKWSNVPCKIECVNTTTTKHPFAKNRLEWCELKCGWWVK